MEFKTLQSFFMRFNKDKLLNLFKEHGLGRDPKKSFFTKDYLCRQLSEHVMAGKVTLKKLQQLDLLYHHGNTKKKWIVYQLEGKGKDGQLNDPDKFQKLVDHELKCFLNCKVCVLTQDNKLLARISMWNGNVNLLLSSTEAIYMVHVSGSSYVFLSTIKAAYKSLFLKAVENLFGCNNLKEIELSGKTVAPLCDLVLNRNSQGSFSQFRLNQMDDNPLSRKRKRDFASSGEENEKRILSEEKKIEQENKRKTLKSFGSNEQPAVEKTEFKMKTRFKAPKVLPELAKETVNCTVLFKGTNVFEGIKKLCDYGLASHPLPAHMRNIHSLSQNSFILTDKNRPEENR